MITHFLALAYPFYLFVGALCGFSLFAMIINLLRWADGRKFSIIM